MRSDVHSVGNVGVTRIIDLTNNDSGCQEVYFARFNTHSWVSRCSNCKDPVESIFSFSRSFFRYFAPERERIHFNIFSFSLTQVDLFICLKKSSRDFLRILMTIRYISLFL